MVLAGSSSHGREAETLTEAEVKDGWGELVNVVGGPPLTSEFFGY